MQNLTRITFNSKVMGGKPCIRGMRVTVDTIVGLVASEYTNEEILEAYPYLEEEDIDEIKQDNAQWDTLFERDEAQDLLDKLADEALIEHKAGRSKPLVFTDDGRMVVG